MKIILTFGFIVCFFSVNAQIDSTHQKLLARCEILTRSGEYQKAFDTLAIALKLAKEHKNNIEIANTLNNIARNYDYKGEPKKALEIYFEALSISEKESDILSQAKIYKNIGALYVEQKDYKTGSKYYEKASFLASKTADRKLVADILNNRGRIFDETGKPDEGLELYLKAYTIYKQLGIQDRIALAANNIAIVYKNKKDYDSAAKYLLESLEISEKMGNVWVAAANYTNLSNIYAGRKDYKKSIFYNNKAIEIAKKINAREITTAAYHNLRENYEALQDYKMSLKMAKLLTEEKDSLFNSDKNQQLTEMREKYEADKRQDTIKLMAQQKLIDNLTISSQELKIKQQNLMWGAGILIFVFVLSIAWTLYNSSKKTEKAQLEAQILRKENEKQTAVYEAEKAERVRIAKDMHDELGSGLSKIAIITANVLNKTKNIEGVNDDMANIAKTANDLVGNMSDLVWAFNADDTNLDYLTARLREFVYDFLDNFDIKFTLNFPDELPEYKISKEVLRNIFLSFKEILNNTIKHSKASELVIDYEIIDKMLKISIKDNGVGFDPENIRKYGNGLKNLKSRMEKIGGDYILITQIGKGTTSELVVNL